MNKTIKIIDLLNKIANGEEIPEKIKYKDIIYNWKVTKKGTGYCNENNYYCEWLANRIHCDEKSVLNDTVEIIEDKEDINIQDIKELEIIDTLKSVGKNVSREENLRRIDEIEVNDFYIINDIIRQQNKLVQAVKHLEKTKEDK